MFQKEGNNLWDTAKIRQTIFLKCWFFFPLKECLGVLADFQRIRLLMKVIWWWEWCFPASSRAAIIIFFPSILGPLRDINFWPGLEKTTKYPWPLSEGFTVPLPTCGPGVLAGSQPAAIRPREAGMQGHCRVELQSQMAAPREGNWHPFHLVSWDIWFKYFKALSHFTVDSDVFLMMPDAICRALQWTSWISLASTGDVLSKPAPGSKWNWHLQEPPPERHCAQILQI